MGYLLPQEGMGRKLRTVAGVPSVGTSEVQTMTIGATPTGGTFKLAFKGQITAPIAWSATTGTLIANIDAALGALSTIGGASNVTTADATLSGGAGTLTITFAGSLAKLDVPLITVNSNDLVGTGATLAIATTTPGVTATHRGAPTGALLVDTTNGVEYYNTGTVYAPIWTATDGTLSAAYLANLTPGTVAASKAVIVDSSKGVNEWNVTGPVTVDGLFADTHSIATPTAAIRLVKSELTVTGAVSGMGTNSAAGVRGLVTLAAAANVTSGFFYGTQGKLVADSATVAIGSNHAAGVYAQASFASGTVTSGHVAALIADVQTPPTTGAANVDAIYAEQVTGTKINSALKAIVNATYAFDLDTTGAGAGATCAPAAGSGGTGSAGYAAGAGIPTRVLKVLIDGAVAYIPLYSTNA